MVRIKQYVHLFARFFADGQQYHIKLKQVSLAGGALIGLIWGGFQVLSWIGGFLIVRDTLHPADALVPLAGDPARVIYAQRLFEQVDVQWFVITNMYVASAYRPGKDFYVFQTQRQAIGYGVPPDRILVNTQTVASTYQEAVILRRMAEEKDWQTLIVVTSPSHTRRARIIFHDVFRNSHVTILMQPIEGHWYTARSWWKTTAGWQETLLEYIKLLHYWLIDSRYERKHFP